jgi:hypothetical protein
MRLGFNPVKALAQADRPSRKTTAIFALLGFRVKPLKFQSVV